MHFFLVIMIFFFWGGGILTRKETIAYTFREIVKRISLNKTYEREDAGHECIIRVRNSSGKNNFADWPPFLFMCMHVQLGTIYTTWKKYG